MLEFFFFFAVHTFLAFSSKSSQTISPERELATKAPLEVMSYRKFLEC